MRLGAMGARGGFGSAGVLGSASIPSWVLRSATNTPAVFQRDPANSRYWFNGRSYATEAAFLTAAGGVTSSNARVFGPFVDPTNTNLVTNGTFDTDTTGWTASLSGAIASVSGECQLTIGAINSSFAQALNTTALGRAFRGTGTGRRGTTLNTIQFSASINSTLTGGKADSTIATTNPTTQSLLFSGVNNTTYYGARNTSASGDGNTAIFDNMSVVEVWPFQGWVHSSIVVLVEATTPTAAGVDQVIWQSDVQTERDRIRLVRLTADNHIHLIVTSNNVAQADLDLGAVADATAFSIAFSCGQNSFSASLNGGVAVTDSSGVCPGAGIMQIGRSFTGNSWTGTDPLVAVF
jgi:hypothetical protein